MTRNQSPFDDRKNIIKELYTRKEGNSFKQCTNRTIHSLWCLFGSIQMISLGKCIKKCKNKTKKKIKL